MHRSGSAQCRLGRLRMNPSERSTDGVRFRDEMTDDQTLLAGLQSGRHDAANALYDTYGASIYAFAWRRTGDAHLSREIVQDVMTNVWRSALTFDPERGTLRSWIFQIARNATFDAGRKRRSRPSVVRELPRHDADPLASDDVEAMFRSWLLTEALDRLPPDHRAVVDAVYFQQLKISEAAATLGVPEGTVKSRCFYALQNMRSALNELGVIAGDL
jgi:RNA polymerase sigma-70 factor, ECF subfamily